MRRFGRPAAVTVKARRDRKRATVKASARERRAGYVAGCWSRTSRESWVVVS